MIEPAAFVTLWGSDYQGGGLVKLVPASPEVPGIPGEALRFLAEAGLPDGCAPFLSFHQLARGLQRISDVSFMPGELGMNDIRRLSPFWIIGSDGEGSPLCLDAANRGQVVLPDHDDFFRSVQFVNTGVAELAECLLAYRRLVEQAQAQNGERAFLDNDIPEGVKQETVLAIQDADAPAWEPGTFWRQEMDSLDWR